MLVEDCQDQSRFYLAILQQLGAYVTLEYDGNSAVRAFRRSECAYHAVLMDYEMPYWNGIETTIALRDIGYSGAIIAMTAYATAQLELEWTAAGCDAFLSKPCSKIQLCEAILQTTEQQRTLTTGEAK